MPVASKSSSNRFNFNQVTNLVMVMKKTLRPYFRKVRSAIIGDAWMDSIRPIAWYNLPFWIWETIAEDLRFYQHQQRALSLYRLKYLFSPNLDNPIFIVGAPRSGTTFLGECISVLPEISYHFEPVLTKAVTRYIYEDIWSQDFSQWFYRTVYGWLMRLHFDADLCFAEKTPQISLIIPFLYKTFPNARFIHIIRDGRDVALSLSKKPWYRNDMKRSGAKEPDGYPFGPKARFWVEPDRIHEYETTDDIHRCIWLWRRYVETIFEAVPQIPKHQYHELRYEDLVRNPDLEAKKLVEFLKINRPESSARVIDAIVKQANPKSVGSWKAQLSGEQVACIGRESGKLLDTLGYIHEIYSNQ